MVVDKLANLTKGLERAVINQALAYDNPALLEIRKQSVRRNPNLLRKYGSQLISFLPIGPPVRGAVLHAYKKDGFEYLGAGANAIALRRGKEVIKVLRLAPIPGEKRPIEPADAGLIADMISRLAEQHPEESVPTEILAKPIHYYPKGAGLMLRQPYIRGHSLENIPDITTLARDHVVSFAERSLDTAPQLGVAPDVVGVNNIIFTSPEADDSAFCMVDSVPLTPEDRRNFQRNTALLRKMAKIKAGKNTFYEMQADAWRLPDAS